MYRFQGIPQSLKIESDFDQMDVAANVTPFHISLSENPRMTRLRLVVPHDAIIERAPRPEPPIEYVGVVFGEADSPSKAARMPGKRYIYSADTALKLTIGDRVEVCAPQFATVVALNQPNPIATIGYCSKIQGRV